MSRRVALVGGLVLAVWFGAIIADHGGNPSTLLAAGADDVRVTGYISAELGPDFEPQEAWGHDGKFVFVHALDPFLTDPARASYLLDSPVYRTQRVLVPAVVGVGGLVGPWGVVWAFPVLMVAAAALGVGATARLVERAGRSPWWGLLFLANPGMFYAYRRGTVDVLAVALLMAGISLVAARRYRPAGGVLALAVLAKEVMVLGAVGMAVYRRRDGRRVLPVIVAPAMAAAVWGVYVRLRLGEPLTTTGADVLTVPVRGFVQAVGGWPEPGAMVALAVGTAIVAALLLAWQRPSVESAAAVGPALLLLVVPVTVWGGYVDAWRAAAPVLAALLVAVLGVVPAPQPRNFVSQGAATIAAPDLSRHLVAGKHRHTGRS